MLPEGVEPAAADFGQNLPQAFPVLPAPTVPRDWFNLLALLDEREGLYNLIARCDLDGRRQDQVLYSIFGDNELPPPRRGAWNAGVARDTAYGALISADFQKSVRDLLLSAFPEKRRRFFIHVPKCAGTDLSAHLAVRFPAIHQSLHSRDYTSRHRLFTELSRIVRLLPWFDFILVHGHINLGDILTARVLRPIDEMFTTLRNPIDIALSQTNYILTRILQDAEAGSFGPDSRTWLKMLDLPVIPAEVTRPMLDEMRLPLLRNIEINGANTICHWLGGGSARDVIDRLTGLNAEVTTTRHYGAWLAQRWQIQGTTRRNESVQFLRKEDLSDTDMAYLHDLTEQDRILFQEVERRIEEGGGASVFMGAAPAAG